MVMKSSPAQRLKEIVGRPEEKLDLAEAALLIAQDEYPELDVSTYLHRLDELAETVRTRLLPDAGPESIIAAMNYLFFSEQGFSGNDADYYDPRNNFLNDVLDRRVGIPITLSIVYMEVGQRLGLPLEGISFPGHFLVKLPTESGDVVLDPYAGGVSLTEEDLNERLYHAYGHEKPDMPLNRLLASAGKKEILARVLRNLKNSYVQTEDFSKALSVIDRLLLIAPNLPGEVRDRGLIYEQLECPHAALQDYRRYLELEPEAPDAEDIRTRAIDLQQKGSALH